ncbi:MAG: hypothetical protein AB8I08_08485 [Sandaracinaceae bacterium]
MPRDPANKGPSSRSLRLVDPSNDEDTSGDRIRKHGPFGEGELPERMGELCRGFPSLRHLEGAGLGEWNADRVLAFACRRERDAGQLAALFVLRVWNSNTDWNIIAHMEGENGEAPILAPGETLAPFELFEAWRIWSPMTRQAALAWLMSPFGD